MEAGANLLAKFRLKAHQYSGRNGLPTCRITPT
jgi:hypothetical protein